MVPNPQQMPSRACGCCDCMIDYPETHYGYRPPQSPCAGRWRLRYRTAGQQRSRQFTSRQDAQQFLASLEARYAA